MPKITRFISLAVLVVLSLLLEPLTAQTVYPEGIESDRPGQAYSSFAVPVNHIQVQAGAGYLLFTGNNDFFQYNSLSNYIIRFGLIENLDVQYSLIPGFSASRIRNPRSSLFEYEAGYDPEYLNLAFRYQVHRGSGMLKAVAIYFEVNAQDFIEGDFTDNPSSNNQIRITAKHQATDRLSFTSNVAVGNVHTDQRDYRYVLNLGYQIGKKWGVFGDVFGTLSNNYAEHNTNIGAYWLPKPNIQLDLFVGRNYAGDIDSNDFLNTLFGEVGASFRLPTKTKTK